MLTTFIALSRKNTQICVENNCVSFDKESHLLSHYPSENKKSPLEKVQLYLCLRVELRNRGYCFIIMFKKQP
jgi:hypothetical protein